MDLGLFCVNLGWKEGLGSSSFGTRGQKSCERWLDLLAPVFLALANVGLVTELSHLLGLGEELVGLLRECLLYRQVTNLAEEEVAEVVPLRSL